MSDLISRQAAIDAIGKVADELYENIKKGATFPQRQWFDGMAHAQSILEDLPSSQPNLQPTCNQLATDCISRQAAINAVYESSVGRQMLWGHKDLITILKNLPSVQSESDPEWRKKHYEASYAQGFVDDCKLYERKTGKWIYGEDEYGIDGYHCDKCGFFVPWDYVHKFISYIEDYNFCPSCGADMRGEEDDDT